MRIPRICFALAAAVLVAGLLPTTALAQGEAKPSLLVLYLDSDGASDKQKEDVLAATKKVVAKYGKYKLLDTPKLDLLDEMVNFECIEMDADCMSAIGKAQKTQLLLYSAFEGGTLSMKLTDVGKKKVLGEYSSSTSAPKITSVVTGKGLVKLFGPLPKKAKLVLVKIDANVEKAEVFINQKRIGPTPLKVKLKPGSYTVSVRKKEFLMVEEKIKIAGGKAFEWKATLKPIPKKKTVVVIPPVTPPPKTKKKGDDDDDDAFYATWWFWTAVGVGTAAAVTGTVLALSSDSDGYDVGTVRFSISPSAAENDAIFYEE